MQNTSKVLQGQSFVDKTIELTGSVEALVQMAFTNNCSITDDVMINDSITGSGVVKSGVVGGFAYRKPATAINNNDEVFNYPEGVDYWAVGLDFEVQ